MGVSDLQKMDFRFQITRFRLQNQISDYKNWVSDFRLQKSDFKREEQISRYGRFQISDYKIA